jgi:hypothetical protein
MRTVIDISKEYTSTPGGRFASQGPYSGEDFRQRFLEPAFEDPTREEQITIILDGVMGFATSFLEEAFGGLARIYGRERVQKRLSFISTEEPNLVDEINAYIENNDGDK